jgi:hypothetical protein
MHHHTWGFRALIQDQSTLELRTIDVPDDDVFYRREGQSEAELQRERNEYVAAVVTGQLRPGERHVQPEEFARFALDDARPAETNLPCPRCRSLLIWRHTGIS